jgi:phenylpyruvate tautomerase PptA (4-oxalocrotonate tautomerase family)
MPLVTIDVLKGRPPEEIEAISDAVHEAMVELLDVPVRDRFQIVTQHGPDTLRFDRHYLDIERSDRFVLVTITLAAGRSTDAKRAFYRRLADLLVERVGLRPEDLALTLVENKREDWSFGNGLASYVELPREAWR